MTSSGPEIHLRRATRADTGEVARLWMALHHEMLRTQQGLRLVSDAEKRFRNDFPDWASSIDRLIVVAEAAGRLVGLVLAEIGGTPAVFEPDSHVFIEALFVEPEYRRMGIGRQLVASVRSWCDSLGSKIVRLGVLAASPAARAFWSAMGAEDESVIMRIDLAGPNG